MNRPPERKDAKAIFSAAIEYYAPEQWEAYLVNACGEDESLRQCVRELLDAHRQSDSFFDRKRDKTAGLAITERPGMRIGPYKLLQEIGEGGFGVVYMAEQVEPVRRKVALKIIKPGMDTKQVIARFEAERQALAMMDHPNIAKVLDAGATESGRPYFVMELVKGVPVTEFCDSNKLPSCDRLELFVTVCRAVQHAHQKGVIHRDLKPTNVMVTLHDNKPMPVIIDFGVSKAISHQLTEKTLFTAYGQMVGTPAYMSPEQAQMSRMDIDTRSDIYSLGVLLYELLTGGPPLDEERLRGTAYAELQRLISEEEAPKPSTRLSTLGKALTKIAQQRGTDPRCLRQFLRGDLDWIVMKALEKERNRRYDTANGMANDIERFLKDEAVEACPPSATYRMRKFVRRNRSLVTAASLVMACVLMGLIVSAAGFAQAARQRNRAVVAEEQAVAAAAVAEQERDKARLERDRAVKAEAVAEQRHQETEQKRKEAEAVIDLLGEMIGSAHPEELKGPKYTVRQLLDDFSAKLDDRLTDQPAVEATVRLMISDVFHQFRMHDRGLIHAKKAYELRRELFGDAHELTIRADRATGLHVILSSSPAKWQEGREILRKIIERHPPFMDVDHEFTIRTKNGEMLFLRGDEKLDGFRELLEDAESTLGHDNPITAIVRGNYSQRLMVAGLLDEAETQARQAVEAREALGGADDPIASLYRVYHARVLDAKDDYEHARAILLQEVAFQRKYLGESHRDTLGTLGSLLAVLYRHDESQRADDLFSEYFESLRSEEGWQSLINLYWLVRVATAHEKTQTTVAGKLLEEAADIYIDLHGDTGKHAELAGQDACVALAAALNRNERSDLAEQVARIAWNTSSSENANNALASNLIRAMLANGNLDAVARFVQQQLPAESDLFRQYDRNSDGQLTISEIPGFFGRGGFEQLDKDSDRMITPDETGEAFWSVVVDADQNEDGSITRGEYAKASLLAGFLRLDRNGDGQLTNDELPALYPVSFARLDTNGDGSVSEKEYIDRTPETRGVRRVFGFFAQSSTPAERFEQNDRDADGKVSKDEADEDFWESIAEFDVNEDNSVDLIEYDAGLQERALEKAESFFSMMDGNSDGQATQDEAPPLLWEQWLQFDANGDGMLNKEEYVKSQLSYRDQNDE